MFDNFLKRVVFFHNLSIVERRNRIESELSEIGVSPKEHVFHSCFGTGCNVWAEIGEKSKKIVLSAHYDGNSIVDNSAGVLSLIGMARQIMKADYPFSVILLFSDFEENFQQGALYFLKDHPFDIIRSINIDGFGIGDNLYPLHELTGNTNTDSDLFLTDRDEFVKRKLPSVSYFSAFADDFEAAKKTGRVFDTFEKYHKSSFFCEKFNEKNHVGICSKILNLLMD